MSQALTAPSPGFCELEFPVAFDAYLQVHYDERALASSIQTEMRARDVVTALDCAAGTGVPALRLRARGIDIDCSDGDRAMVDQFQVKARRLGVADQCDVLDWSQLHQLGKRYDYVMCRGNSLVYASSWGGGDVVADRDGIRHYLRQMASAVDHHGFLHVDAPLDLALAHQARTVESCDHHDLVMIDGELSVDRVTVSEWVTELVASRLWGCSVRTAVNADPLADTRNDFTRHSSKLTIDDVHDLLVEVGFGNFDYVDLKGDRPTHAAIIAQKLG